MATPVLKSVVFGGLVAVALCLAPTVHADDNKPSPGAPTIRSADRGTALAGPSDVRIAKKGEIQGGTTSAGAPILIKDGNAAPAACNPIENFQDPILPSCG